MPQGLVQPARGILHSGNPTIIEYEVETIAEMMPGRLVQTDTDAERIEVQVSGGADTLGVLDVEYGELRTSNYDAGDQARVLSGNCVVLLTKDSGTALTVGAKVSPGNVGMIQTWPGLTLTAGDIIGYALEAVAKETKARVLVKLSI